jgi:hypothetical protein
MKKLLMLISLLLTANLYATAPGYYSNKELLFICSLKNTACDFYFSGFIDGVEAGQSIKLNKDRLISSFTLKRLYIEQLSNTPLLEDEETPLTILNLLKINAYAEKKETK